MNEITKYNENSRDLFHSSCHFSKSQSHLTGLTNRIRRIRPIRGQWRKSAHCRDHVSKYPGENVGHNIDNNRQWTLDKNIGIKNIFSIHRSRETICQLKQLFTMKFFGAAFRKLKYWGGSVYRIIRRDLVNATEAKWRSQIYLY